MTVVKQDYPSVADKKRYEDRSFRFEMTSSSGMVASVITYGARIDRLLVPDKDGKPADIMLGMRGLDEYLRDGGNHGAIVGRSANRIRNASFVIDGETYKLPANDGQNNLHTGNPAYQNVFWEGEIISKDETDNYIEASGIAGIEEADGDSILMHYVAADGECGFPGNLDTTVIYSWLKDDTLLILYRAETDKATVFAPTNHSYFNLGGHDSGSVLSDLITVNADRVTLKDETNCNSSEYLDVEGTVFDLREQAFISQIVESDEPQIVMSRGIDMNYCINGYNGNYNYAAMVSDPDSGRLMEVYTDFPGIQLYAGNHLGGNDQKGDKPYKPYDAICLEAQMYPNSINIPGFESPVVRPGEVRYHACGYKFGII